MLPYIISIFAFIIVTANGNLYHHLYHNADKVSAHHQHCQNKHDENDFQFESEHHHCAFPDFIKQYFSPEINFVSISLYAPKRKNYYSEYIDNTSFSYLLFFTGLSPPAEASA